MLLHLAVEWVARDLGAVRCFGAMAPRVGRMVVEVYGWHHPEDPEPVDIFYFDHADLRPARTVLNMALRQARRGLRSLQPTGPRAEQASSPR